MQFICYSKCSTCKKAQKWLDQLGLDYNMRDIKEDKPTFDELKLWHEQSKLPIKGFFNTSGVLYRQLNLKDKLADMSVEDQIQLLATDGMLVKRPILIDNEKVLVGFKSEEWEEALL